ncbi:MAG: oligosaccharide flippase family protein [Solirubrobacterales bacterium]|nr:oligosaccharide flippase family protein [Solirubrobacterales bacterium]
MATPVRTRIAEGRARFGPEGVRGHLRDPLYRTSYYLIVGTGVTSVLGVVFWALAAHAYSAHDVGLNAAVISAMTLVSGVCSLGLSAVLVRYLPISGGATHKLVSRSYMLTGAISVVVGALVALTSEIWSPKLSFLSEGTWLVGFTAAVFAFTIFTLQDSVLTGLRAAKWIPLENTLYSVAKILILFALAVPLPAAGLFVAWTAPLLPAVLIVNYLIFKRLIPKASKTGSLDRRKMISMATGNYGGNLFSLVGTLFLPILVANLTSAEEAAYFYVPWLISISLQLVAINVMTSLTVEAALDMPSMGTLARRAVIHTARLVLPLAALTAVAAPWILLVFGQDYSDAGTALLRWLALGAVPNIIVSLGISIGRIEHRGWIVVAAQGATAVFVVALSAILLPGMGITGVGIAWTASQALLAAVMLATILRPLLLPHLGRR